MEWIHKIFSRIVSEVYKSKIESLENRLLEMEKKHEVYSKTISDSEKKIEQLQDKLYNANVNIAKFEGALGVLVDRVKDRQPAIMNGGERYE